MHTERNKRSAASFKVRASLLGLQLLLPFGLYFFLQRGSMLAAAVLAGAVILTMLGMVWLE